MRIERISPEIELTSQMKCAIGEQLVCAHLIAQGWPTFNANSTISNFNDIDLICQRGIEGSDSSERIGIQVKTTFQKISDGISIGMHCEQAADRGYLTNHITGPWVFVHCTESDHFLDINFYILSKKQTIDLVYGLHQWYLYGREQQPKESVKKSPAHIRIEHIQGKRKYSTLSGTHFNNPIKSVEETLNKWENIWVKE